PLGHSLLLDLTELRLQPLRRAAAHYRRQLRIVDQGREVLLRGRQSLIGGGDGGRRGCLLPAALREPAGNLLRGPVRLAVGMAPGAGVWGTQLSGQVGARYGNVVIAARVDDHIVTLRHMTADTLGATRIGSMVMMRGPIELCRQVAAAAQCITLGTQRLAVRLMTITAGNAGGMHAALGEAAADEYFLALLAIGKVQRIAEQFGAVEIQQWQAGVIPLGGSTAQRVALGAHLLFLVRAQRHAAPRRYPLQFMQPVHVLALIQQQCQPLVCPFLPLGPLQMPTAWPMTCLTAHPQLRPFGGEALRLRV